MLIRFSCGKENNLLSLPAEARAQAGADILICKWIAVYSKLQLVYKYLHYYLTASSGKGHGIHSPFVYDFITKVLNDKAPYPAYEKVEAWRKKLLHDKAILTVEDYGAGSAMTNSNDRSISDIARYSVKPKKYGQLLFRMVRHYQPSTILELGTSLGITTSYLSFSNTGAKLNTLEGSKAVADVARQTFHQLDVKNAVLIEGNFDDKLQWAIKELSSVEFAFIDGNHRLQPTVRYFQQLLPAAGKDSILIFDDIHWSSEMEAAWQTIIRHPAVRCSIDLFFIGIVFFRNEFREKQHFTIRF